MTFSDAVFLGALRVKRRSVKVLFDDVYVIISSDFLYKNIFVATHLNCIDKSMQFKFFSMQFKWIPTTYAFIKK